MPLSGHHSLVSLLLLMVFSSLYLTIYNNPTVSPISPTRRNTFQLMKGRSQDVSTGGGGGERGREGGKGGVWCVCFIRVTKWHFLHNKM